MSHHTHQQETQSAKNTTPTRQRKLSQAALDAQARLQETMARWRQEGHFPQAVLERHGLTKGVEG